MIQVFRLPDLGEGIHEGEVIAVLVAVGDRVQEDQPILEIETDKARVEIPSPVSCVVKEISVKPGDIVMVGSALMSFDDGAESGAMAGADTRLVETGGTSGLFVSMPSKKRKDGTFRDIAHPLNSETRRDRGARDRGVPIGTGRDRKSGRIARATDQRRRRSPGRDRLKTGPP